MGWSDHYRRRDAIDLVLARARHGRPADALDSVPDEFADREELALALQYRWAQLLTGAVDVALADAGSAADADQLDAVATAWRTTALRNRELRAVLDEYADQAGPTFLRMRRAEQRTLALAAGLADADEAPDELAAIGAAFLALVRDPRGTRNHANPGQHLAGRLVASG